MTDKIDKPVVTSGDNITTSRNTHLGPLSTPATAEPLGRAPLQHRDKITKCNAWSEPASRTIEQIEELGPKD